MLNSCRQLLFAHQGLVLAGSWSFLCCLRGAREVELHIVQCELLRLLIDVTLQSYMLAPFAWYGLDFLHHPNLLRSSLIIDQQLFLGNKLLHLFLASHILILQGPFSRYILSHLFRVCGQNSTLCLVCSEFHLPLRPHVTVRP